MNSSTVRRTLNQTSGILTAGFQVEVVSIPLMASVSPAIYSAKRHSARRRAGRGRRDGNLDERQGADGRRYVAKLAERALAALSFDFTGFGLSGGEPREVESPSLKARNIHY